MLLTETTYSDEKINKNITESSYDETLAKIKQLLCCLPVDYKLKAEAEATRQISEDLVEKRQECRRDKKKWVEYLQEKGFTQKDVNKRIKAAVVPSVLWPVGSVMALQLAAPQFEPVRDFFTKKDVPITQEAVEAKMEDVREMRRQLRELKKQNDEQRNGNFWKRDKDGRRYWEVGKSYDQQTGIVLQALESGTGKSRQTIVADALHLLAQQKNISSDIIQAIRDRSLQEETDVEVAQIQEEICNVAKRVREEMELT